MSGSARNPDSNVFVIHRPAQESHLVACRLKVCLTFSHEASQALHSLIHEMATSTKRDYSSATKILPVHCSHQILLLCVRLSPVPRNLLAPRDASSRAEVCDRCWDKEDQLC